MLEEATAICEKGVKEHPTYTSGYVVQGKCYYDLGQLDRAEQAFRKVLELDQNNLVALKYIGLIIAGKGREVEAMGHFKHVLALDPEDREIKAKLEDLEEAPAEPLRVPDDDFEGEPIDLGGGEETSDELATSTLADIYADQGYTDKAERIYREILKKQPDNEQIKRKLAKLGADQSTPKVAGEWEDSDGKDLTGSGESTRPATADTDAWLLEGFGDEEETHEDEAEAAGMLAAGAAPPATDLEKERPQEKTARRRAIDDQKSFEQFKRWIKDHST
jgi:tetratricopeptide (TPR) repeat protein